MNRVCCCCNKTFPIEDFPKANNRSGHAYMCVTCKRKKEHDRKSNNIRAYMVDLLRTSKQMSKKRDIDCHNLDVDFLIELYNKQNGKCAISGITMTHISGQGCVPTNISIDRISNNIGYERDNIQLTCRFINQAKMTMSMEEFSHIMHETFVNMFCQDCRGQKEEL